MQCQRSIMQTSPLRHNLVRRVTVISSLFCHGEHVLFVTRVTTSIHVSINSACSWDPFFMILPCFLWIFLDQIILCSVGTRISSLFSPRSLCFLINLVKAMLYFFFFQTAWLRYGAFSHSLRKPWLLWWRCTATRLPDSCPWLITNCAPHSTNHPQLHITLWCLKPLKKVNNKILCNILSESYHPVLEKISFPF